MRNLADLPPDGLDAAACDVVGIKPFTRALTRYRLPSPAGQTITRSVVVGSPEDVKLMIRSDVRRLEDVPAVYPPVSQTAEGAALLAQAALKKKGIGWPVVMPYPTGVDCRKAWDGRFFGYIMGKTGWATQFGPDPPTTTAADPFRAAALAVAAAGEETRI